MYYVYVYICVFTCCLHVWFEVPDSLSVHTEQFDCTSCRSANSGNHYEPIDIYDCGYRSPSRVNWSGHPAPLCSHRNKQSASFHYLEWSVLWYGLPYVHCFETKQHLIRVLDISRHFLRSTITWIWFNFNVLFFH
jgi:hypothetical protein